MPDKIIYLFVNGILTFPGESDNWTGKAVTWTMTRPELPAEKVEYWVDPISRVFGQKKRAKKLIKTMLQYQDRGWQVVLCGHSNGCDVILDALQQMGWPLIKELHLISAACCADFNRNGLNQALIAGRIGWVTAYVAGRDWALKLANTLPAKILGYGDLGRTGPVNQSTAIAGLVEVVTEPDYGHSDWFAPDSFDDTMNRITKTRGKR